MKWVLYIGAILTMVGSLLHVALHNRYGMPMVYVSNIFLYLYAVDAVLEFCRNLVLLQEESNGDKV